MERDEFEDADPLYKQWVFTKAMARAAAAGSLDVMQMLSNKFPGCYVTDAVNEAAKNGHQEVLRWLFEHHPNVQWGGDEIKSALRNNHLEVA